MFCSDIFSPFLLGVFFNHRRAISLSGRERWGGGQKFRCGFGNVMNSNITNQPRLFSIPDSSED